MIPLYLLEDLVFLKLLGSYFLDVIFGGFWMEENYDWDMMKY